MSAFMMAVAVLLPIVGGIMIRFLPFKTEKTRNIFTEILVIITSVITFALVIFRPAEGITIFHFTGALSIGFALDGVGSVFAVILAFLWPFCTLYAFEYMEHEERRTSFFAFYTVTYGVTLGIAFSEGILTMYFFYELLTMVTIPLVVHTMTQEAIRATRTYMYYSIGGAAFAFIGMVFLLSNSLTSSFTAGGMLDPAVIAEDGNIFLFIYVICFCGFSVKAAMVPFSSWLPKAGVAPTPVTALLHAVAVVKAGAFACIRVTYFCFGVDFLAGTWAQDLLMTLTIITIVYGCSRALKETHFKRRLAWSTVSNLSYILFGVLMMSPLGLAGALSHMVCHALMKICSFLCAGAVICKTEKQYIHELDGMGRKMPLTFVAFAISGMALMGVPGLCGFVSKWNLAKAAVINPNNLTEFGIAAILISALLTAIYMMSIVVRAFFPGRFFNHNKMEFEPGFGPESPDGTCDPSYRMLIPIYAAVVVMFLIGLHPAFLNELIDAVVGSVF